jgi:flavin-dependent dehydrogenase
MQFDVIVVGAGPAGLTAAMTAARAGMSVLLVDTKENITRQTRPCCSMWLLEPGFHNEAWTFANNKIHFQENDFSIPYTGATVDLYRSVRITSQGHTMVMGKKLFPIAKVIDKEKLLHDLLACAIEAGVEVRQKIMTPVSAFQENTCLLLMGLTLVLLISLGSIRTAR